MITKDWSCEKKQAARQATIIDQYRQHFGWSVPESQQYWTMCGQSATDFGEPRGCELSQMLDAGLIVQEQFHGVEIEPAIHALNQQAWPDIHWHNNDFYWAMVTHRQFHPGIVNADLIQTVDRAGDYVSKIMSMLAKYHGVMFVANFVMRARSYSEKSPDYVLDRLVKYPTFQDALRRGWEFTEQCYLYPGTGRSRVVMGSFVFIKERRSGMVAA